MTGVLRLVIGILGLAMLAALGAMIHTVQRERAMIEAGHRKVCVEDGVTAVWVGRSAMIVPAYRCWWE